MTNPFHLPLKPRFLAAAGEAALGLRPLARIYERRPPHLSPQEFLQYTLDSLGVTVQVENGHFLADLPREGPLLVVANHPLGGLEGVAIARAVSECRPDLRVLTNELLRRIPELAELFIGVDVLSANAAAANVGGIKQVHRQLRDGAAVLVFPAGMVSAWNHGSRRVMDRPWSRLVGQLVQRYQCATMPVHVGGRNSAYFYGAGLVHPRLRTLLLPRQLANKQGFRLPLTFGRPVAASELRLLRSPKATTEYLRVSVDALAPQPAPAAAGAAKGMRFRQLPQPQSRAPVVAAIAALGDARLIEHEEIDVYCAPWARLGALTEEIAVARETAFRAVGEGTGQERDSDRFDPHYQHLFLWDKRRQAIAGAYRVGRVDEIVAGQGVSGLYSRSLYKYNLAFIERLGGAIEMGRSFIHPDYQRAPISLNLLWRGIGKILADDPRYHTLFGSVSVSRDYSDRARALIADAMLTNYRADDFTGLVKPITPHRVRERVWSDDMLAELANVKMLGRLVGRCDPGKAVPVLLRHYLSLNGRLVCFNIHPNFNDSLEGLIIVDVRKTDPKTLRRFMGEEGQLKFLGYHRERASA